MAVFNEQFYERREDELYSDGQVEDQILDRVRQHDDTLKDSLEWPVFYHFSQLRENILNWYPFRQNSSVLEIGGGCGAITGLLTRRAKRVVSNELTMRRARILFERHIDAENLEVVVGDFLRVRFRERFDYVVVNGVLEYSRSIMRNREDPFCDFLIWARKLLNPGGKILVAIENRLGLKYFAGAPEDHLGSIFAGIVGYGPQALVRTFSRGELEELCRTAGLKVRKWYYPYPDYKFPTEIFTDCSINTRCPVSLDRPYDLPRLGLFDAGVVWRGLMKDTICSSFSNSFLVELVAEKEPEEDDNGPDYVKICNNRMREFAVCTSLYSKRRLVEKQALYPEGAAHLKAMAVAREQNGFLRELQAEYTRGILTCPYIQEKSLEERLGELDQTNQRELFQEVLEQLKMVLFNEGQKDYEENEEFHRVFGDVVIKRPLHWRRNLNVDLTAGNIFWRKDGWTIIDNEWVFSFPIPAEYALWRMAQQLRETNAAPFLTDQSIREYLELGEMEEGAFRLWEYHFSTKYVGIRDLSGLWKPTYPVNADRLLEEEKKRQSLVCRLFLFQKKEEEPTILESPARLENGIWKVCFCSEMISTAKRIRWDPLEGSACRIFGVEVEGLRIEPCNAEMDQPEYTFATFDPQFLISGSNIGNQIEIQFQCQILDWTKGYFRRERELQQVREELRETATLLGGSERELQQVREELRETATLLGGSERELRRVLTETVDHRWKSVVKILLKKEL